MMAYDDLYPKGPGQYPIYPAPGNLYNPGGPQNPAYPVLPQSDSARESRVMASRNLANDPSAMMQAQATTQQASAADNAREMKGFQSGVRGGNYVAPGTYESRPGGANNPYGPDFAFRDMLAANKANPGATAPGDTAYVNYGPGYGGQTIKATADKNGRFNSFSDAPSAPSAGGGANTGTGAPDPYGINQQMAMFAQRAAYYRQQPGLVAKIFAANAQRQLNTLQQHAFQMGSLGVAQGRLGVEQGLLGVAQGHLALQDRNTYPDVALANLRNRAYQAGDLNSAQAIVAAQHGAPNILTVPGIGGTVLRRPQDVPAGGEFVPGFPVAPGQSPMMAPQLQPLNTLRTNNEGY